jgi:hypothetical protein
VDFDGIAPHNRALRIMRHYAELRIMQNSSAA